MKNISVNKPFLQNDYWETIKSTLSTYESKSISKNGNVIKEVVYDDYFLKNDIWNVNEISNIPNFQEQLRNFENEKNIQFLTKSQSITLEIKFVFYKKLFSDEWSLKYLFNGLSSCLGKLLEFLEEKYSHIISLLNLDIEKTEKEWIWWLNNKGLKTTSVSKQFYGEYIRKQTIARFLRQINSELFKLSDTREEWEKDAWDIRTLKENYNISHSNTNGTYLIYFTDVENVAFRHCFKKYMKTRLLNGKNFSWGTALRYSTIVSRFLNFITETNPSWNDLNRLTRKDIESYLQYLYKYSKNNLKRKNANPKAFILMNVKIVYSFLRDIQRFEYDIAPNKSTEKLLYPEDYLKLDKKSDDEIDYIPDHVLEQLFESINDLHPDVQAIIWTSFKTGLRIDDTLCLTQDCLIKLNGKYSIVTDIEKTYVKGHKIPIDDQLAGIIAALIDKSKHLSNDDNNPDKYIFVRYLGVRKGKPFSQQWVRSKLNEFAHKKNITDELGNTFHFKMHQFRHTYAVKMLNGGADILTVQELLAHASPEMTMRYARLLDDTKRKAFEKVVKQGVFTFDLNGEMHQVSASEEVPENIMDMMWQNEKLNALDNPYGSCRARINGNCPLAAEPPCLTANDGKPCFDLAVGISDMDVKKYELHIESTTRMIEAAKQFGREDMVEANQKNLERYQNIYETIRVGNIVFGRFDRMQRELDKKRKKGVKRG